ncbi:ImmA/IrrE family metallo-endopeptidase [Lysinibacillus parviboronicapiens]|uniref:ImmA/IrrE family metallo-endopeptidase n=1 Tax=Lysinibacillus parviboronicapiens TaxID=436516 RepID=UPI0033937075
MWQEFCHELCHVLWHSGSQKVMPYSWIQYQECKADNFMLHACVPTFMLNKIRLPINEERAIIKICLLFNVKYDFAEKRINHYLNNHFFNNCNLVERSY